MATLIDIRDEVTVAKNYITCLYLAAQAGARSDGERAALCEVSNAAREKLEAIGGALDELLARVASGTGSAPARRRARR